MAKETKIGLIVVLVLLVTFGLVLARRIYKSTRPSLAATASESTSVPPPATDGATSRTANDTVVIAGLPGSETPGSTHAGTDGALPQQSSRRWTHAHDHHPRHATDPDQTAARQAFLPPNESDSTRQDMAVLRPAHSRHAHAVDETLPSEPSPPEFQFAGQTAPTSAIQQTAASSAQFQAEHPQHQPRYPADEPQPIHDSNYRQQAIQQPLPSYRDSTYQQSALDEQPVQRPASPAGDDQSSSRYGSPAQVHQRDVDFAGHHQQHAHPAPFQQQPVGQYGGHAHGPHQQLAPPTAEGGVFVVRPNDTFWTIAETVYGSGDYFKALIEHNRQQHPLPDRLAVGDKVLAPPLGELVQNHPELCPRQRRPATAIAVSGGAAIRPGREYAVREGDTLYDIARYELGDATRWVEIYNLNKQLMTADFDYLKPGTRIALPARVRGPISRTAQQRDPARLR